jgi:hypothetical protein
VYGNVGVIAISIISDVTRRGTTRLCGIGHRAIPVSVGIPVEGALYSLIDLTVAVVVHTITNFSRARINVRIVIVAVPLCHGKPVSVGIL